MLVGWLFWGFTSLQRVFFQQYRALEAVDNQSLKSKRQDRESNPGPIGQQAKSLTTTPPLLLTCIKR